MSSLNFNTEVTHEIAGQQITFQCLTRRQSVEVETMIRSDMDELTDEQVKELPKDEYYRLIDQKNDNAFSAMCMAIRYACPQFADYTEQDFDDMPSSVLVDCFQVITNMTKGSEGKESAQI